MIRQHAVRLTLFVTGATPRTETAVANLRRLCRDRLGDACEVSIIDVLDDPDTAERRKVLATPTLIKESPPPVRRVTGDLSDPERVLEFLMLAALPRREEADGP